jgi:tetratricopeptide (TPR) repeat protein
MGNITLKQRLGFLPGVFLLLGLEGCPSKTLLQPKPMSDCKSIELCTKRGDAFRDIKDYNKAIADYSQAISLSPKSSIPYKNRGWILNEQGEWDKVIENFDQAIVLESADTHAYLYRGFSFYSKGEWEKSIADYTQAIGLDPKYHNAYIGRGAAFAKRK